MAVNDLQCPNCGAPVDFAGGTRATCSFCRSHLYFSHEGITLESTLNDLVEGQPVVPSVDVQQVQDLVQSGKKIEAIKLVRQQTNLGLKEAKDAVEAIERGETVDLQPRPTREAHGVSGVDLDEINELLLRDKKIDAIKLYRAQTGAGLKEAKDAVEAIEATGWPPAPSEATPGVKSTIYRAPRTKSSSATGCLGCLPLLLFIGLCAGLIALTSQVAFRAWGPLNQTLQVLNGNPQVTRVFGQPLTVGVFITGEISGGGSSSSADFAAPLYGPKRSGELSVSGNWRKGVWALNIWVTYVSDDGEEQTIQISQKVP